MDIAAMSTMFSQEKTQQAVSLSVMKMAMNSAENAGQMISKLADTNTKIMEQSVSPHLGRNIDAKV